MTPEELRALEDVRGYSRAGRVVPTEHARRRMRERSISWADLVAALARAGLCAALPGEKWRITGLDRSGDEMTSVVVLDEGVLVVTVF